jgi:hypothetical protein
MDGAMIGGLYVVCEIVIPVLVSLEAPTVADNIGYLRDRRASKHRPTPRAKFRQSSDEFEPFRVRLVETTRISGKFSVTGISFAGLEPFFEARSTRV